MAKRFVLLFVILLVLGAIQVNPEVVSLRGMMQSLKGFWRP
jgi:hypothetical protein